MLPYSFTKAQLSLKVVALFLLHGILQFVPSDPLQSLSRYIDRLNRFGICPFSRFLFVLSHYAPLTEEGFTEIASEMDKQAY